jgi:hypothetical protein
VGEGRAIASPVLCTFLLKGLKKILAT